MDKFELPAPPPLEGEEKKQPLPFDKPEEMDEDEPKEATGGTPPGYRGEMQNCEQCEYFDLFGEVTCKKFKFDADPTGTCDAHEPISGFNTEGDSDNMEEGEESPEVEVEE